MVGLSRTYLYEDHPTHDIRRNLRRLADAQWRAVWAKNQRTHDTETLTDIRAWEQWVGEVEARYPDTKSAVRAIRRHLGRIDEVVRKQSTCH